MKSGSAEVYFNNLHAGTLSKRDGYYYFQYSPEYLSAQDTPPISTSFPKQEEEFKSKILFPFFFGLLSEGANKEIECSTLKIDENDHFVRLLETLINDSIGGITVRRK
ncbi:MAG: phosphatidylinositol kinase [Ignavibacteriales bacterium]|nr:phosphatidylinositol kinase [Ignavibacteriales bacterium]HPO55857.1 HipA N-terminal domain-containing protein [Ignavibacteriaceae bacterium]